MKRFNTLLIILGLIPIISVSCKDHCPDDIPDPSQKITKLIIRPGACDGKDAFVHESRYTENFGDHPENLISAWTYSKLGLPAGACRSLIEFDLTDVPSNAKVKSAKLMLFFRVGTRNCDGKHTQRTGSNEGEMYLITEDWDEHKVMWPNRPAVDAGFKQYIPASTSGTQDYTIDVLKFVQKWVKDPSSNHGVMMRMINESPYRGLIFASSDEKNKALHPKLVVEYVE